MELAIRLDHLIRARRTPIRTSLSFNPVGIPEAEPMQIGYTRLSEAERERRRRNHLCMYCGQAGHLRASCPVKATSRNPAAVSSRLLSSKSFTVDISLIINGEVVKSRAFIDSGAAGNFIDATFAKTHRISLHSCEPTVTVTALDGRPLGTGERQYITPPLTLSIGPQHKETIQFYTIHSSLHPMILGFPWLERHNPQISW